MTKISCLPQNKLKLDISIVHNEVLVLFMPFARINTCNKCNYIPNKSGYQTLNVDRISSPLKRTVLLWIVLLMTDCMQLLLIVNATQQYATSHQFPINAYRMHTENFSKWKEAFLTWFGTTIIVHDALVELFLNVLNVDCRCAKSYCIKQMGNINWCGS